MTFDIFLVKWVDSRSSLELTSDHPRRGQGIALSSSMNRDRKVFEMRKSKAEAAETRRRIIEVAAREFRRDGIHGASLADVMSAAGLSHGGFYRHFGSKEELVAEALAAAMESILERAGAAADLRGDKSGIDAIVDAYLAIDHRDERSAGCPLAGLGSELARRRRDQGRGVRGDRQISQALDAADAATEIESGEIESDFPPFCTGRSRYAVANRHGSRVFNRHPAGNETPPRECVTG